ncbi:MAG: sensor histidine kinase [Atopobiaceae bacterium]|nr:sensor histidine kinase [Atopobiaceae bacterium]
MLKKLRHKFVAIVMALTGTVLVAVLGSTYITTYQTQQELIQHALDHTIHENMDARPTIGSMRPMDDERGRGMVSILIDVNDDGIIMQLSDASVLVNMEVLDEVIDNVYEDGMVSGTDRDAHVAWLSEDQDDGGKRIALVDTSSSDTLLYQQAIKDLKIICVALLALFVISWKLSDWALRPVSAAWEQQRRFVADASHELKTPLAVILANTQILEKHEGVGPDAMRWVQSTSDEANHMKSLVSDLLELARTDATVAGESANAMRHEPVDLSDLVESAALEFDAIAFERGCMLESEVTPGLTVQGDRNWLNRLVRILIDNACKYGADGTSVDVRLAQEAVKTVLTVHNMGNPIDEEDLPHVFERFYRSDKARSREAEGGFGLGLAIAKGIADAHGAQISVTSSEKDGTTFTVIF